MISTEELGLNLRRARVMKDLTQDAAATKAGLTRVAYRSIEDGVSRPKAATLDGLAAALGVKVADLLRPSIPLPRARFRSRKKMNSRNEILLTVVRQLDDYVGLEEVLGTRAEYTLAKVALRVRREKGERSKMAAELVRKELGLGLEPIRDIAGVLEESAGVKLTRMPVATDAFFGLAIADDGIGPAIAVNTWPRISVERWIFSAAHELGHLILHGDDFEVAEVVKSASSEREADVFASHFLMPAELFDKEWEETAGADLWDRVLKVKEMFGVSYKTVLYRLHERGIADIWKRFQTAAKRRTGRTLGKADEPEPLSDAAFGYGSPTLRKADEPEGLNPVRFTADRRARLVRQAIEAGEISLGRGAEILSIDIRRMRELKASWI